MNSKQIGTLGEKIAEKYLKNKGYQILDRNYSIRIPDGPLRGEIDIVAKKSDLISFIEIKTLRSPAALQRSPATLIRPEEKVNFLKQRKLRMTAESWLMKKRLPLDCQWQVDVISIIINLDSKKAKIRHFQNI